jgi:hypothetical protein
MEERDREGELEEKDRERWRRRVIGRGRRREGGREGKRECSVREEGNRRSRGIAVN